MPANAQSAPGVRPEVPGLRLERAWSCPKCARSAPGARPEMPGVRLTSVDYVLVTDSERTSNFCRYFGAPLRSFDKSNSSANIAANNAINKRYDQFSPVHIKY